MRNESPRRRRCNFGWMKKNYTEEIEDYLLGNLDVAAARALEKRAAADPVLAAQIELEQDILKGIELAGDAATREKIAATDRRLAGEGFFGNEKTAEFKVEQGGRFFINFRSWAAAATVLLAIAAGVWWWSNRPTETEIAQKPPIENPPADEKNQPQPAPQTIEPAEPSEKTPTRKTEKTTPARPHQPDSKFLALAKSEWTSPDFSNIRSTGGGSATPISQAAEAFQKKDFQRVIALLADVPPSASNFWQVSEMLAHAEFLSGKISTARARFRQVAESSALPFSERAEGALLLCFVADLPQSRGDFEFLLKKILADDGHPSFALAQKLAAI